jgi:hypothetical protein
MISLMAMKEKAPLERGAPWLYGKPGIAVPLEMRVDGKHRNVGFLALSGRCTVTPLTTAPSHHRM